ncbi:Transcription factor TGA like domain [Dillenia turbinata]|uniref:Transcription factor TGA like domain n=1 Tax=Dillenia turbinata TaxID=194707 RepID=A0AAN8VU80_9MAGN
MCFERFYESWVDNLHRLIHQLTTAYTRNTAAAAEQPNPNQNPSQETHLLQLINSVMTHYTEYYRVKSIAANNNVLSVFSAPWISSLERSLRWIGGWRPTTVFHLIYTESSIHFESRIDDILRGHSTGDLGDLTPTQLRRVSDLQCETVREENEINEELAEWQDSVSDMMKTLMEMESMANTTTGTTASSNDGGDFIDGKIGRLAGVLERADDLRLRTVRRVVDLLTPQQTVEFLIAAAELQFGVRGWGVNHDRQRGNADH